MKVDLKNIPQNPGVYLMKDINEKVIYVGKAKNLKNRVISYFNNPKSSMKTFELVKHINDIEFFLCNSERKCETNSLVNRLWDQKIWIQIYFFLTVCLRFWASSFSLTELLFS